MRTFVVTQLTNTLINRPLTAANSSPKRVILRMPHFRYALRARSMRLVNVYPTFALIPLAYFWRGGGRKFLSFFSLFKSYKMTENLLLNSGHQPLAADAREFLVACDVRHSTDDLERVS